MHQLDVEAATCLGTAEVTLFSRDMGIGGIRGLS
jgi:hypothetical protein